MSNDKKKSLDYGFYFGASKELLRRAKELRANQTPTEKLL